MMTITMMTLILANLLAISGRFAPILCPTMVGAASADLLRGIAQLSLYLPAELCTADHHRAMARMGS